MSRLPLLVVVVAGCGLFGETSTDTVDIPVPAGITKVVVEIGAGMVDIGEARDDAPSGRFERSWTGNEPLATSEVAGDVLRVTGSCSDAGPRCATDVILRLPEGLDVEVTNRGGAVDVKGPLGDVVVESNAGLVFLVDTVGDVRVVSATGRVEATNLRSDEVEIDVDAAGIEVMMLEPPVNLDAQTGAGDVLLEVPEGTYAVDASAGVGRASVFNIDEDDGAANTIRARTEVGDVEVRGISP